MSKIKLPFPYRPKKKKRKNWVVGVVGLNLDSGTAFGNTMGGEGGVGDGGNGGGGMGEAIQAMETMKPMEEQKFASPYRYGCAMLDLSDEVHPIITYWAKKFVPVDYLYVNETMGIEGYEDSPHVTVKYGIHDTTPEKIKELIEGYGNVDLKFGKVSIFDVNPEFDVLKIDIESEKIFKLNKMISENMQCTDKFENAYAPHVTLAYVNKGMCQELIGNEFFTNLTDSVSTLTFASNTGKEYFIEL